MDILSYKQFAYDVVRMEVEEGDRNFFILCGKLARAILCFMKEGKKDLFKIAEIAKYIHGRCMLADHKGEYALRDRMIGGRMCIQPIYIHMYMVSLDNFYIRNKQEEDINIHIFFNFLKIHPFLDGNGRVAKTIFAILENNFITKIKSVKEHKVLCKELNRMQKKENILEMSVDIKKLRSLLK